MFKKLAEFYRVSLQNFFEATFNYLIFLPYFFSVKNLLKTLFSPWKNLVKPKTGVGLDLVEVDQFTIDSAFGTRLGDGLHSNPQRLL